MFWLLSWLTPLLMFFLPVVSIFLIILVLLQRGRGGGLVGAFGGAGGQSAFGTKAGDLFTKITVVTVCFWFLICILLIVGLKQSSNARNTGFGDGSGTPAAATVPAEASTTTPATTTPATTAPAAAPAAPAGSSAETPAPADAPAAPAQETPSP